MNSIKRIAVIGLGYVGLPLSLLAEKKGFSVTGIDLDTNKIENLNNKNTSIDEPLITEQLNDSNILFTNKFDQVKDADAVVICVPTPVDENKTPDLQPVINAVKSTTPLMKDGSLLVIESTINPGVCDEVIIPLIENETDHQVGKSIYLAHCPERINPGDPKWNVSNINRVVGASTDEGLKLAHQFYSNLVDAEVMKMGSLKEAEAVKIVENSFRDINIAFVNELAMSFNKLGININNVIDGAATKPFAFLAHYPGIGVGGHCIPVDPYYLIEYAKGKGFNHEFLKLARSINEGMPKFVVDNIIDSLTEKGDSGSLEGKSIAVLGLSYKPNVADDRMSPSYSIIEQLESLGADVATYDPFIDKSSEKDLESALKNRDIVILATNHKQFLDINPAQLKPSSIFFDGKSSFDDKREEFEKNNITYLSISN